MYTCLQFPPYVFRPLSFQIWAYIRRGTVSQRKHKGVRGSIPGRDRPTIVKIGSDSTTAKVSVTDVSVTGPRK